MLSPTGVLWHPIFDRMVDVSSLWLPWILPMFSRAAAPGWFPGHYAANWFLNHVYWQNQDRYLLLNDDDFYEPDFFPKVDSVDGDVLVCSMKRGQHSPAKTDTPAQACNDLIAAQENLTCGGIGGEQIILAGHVQRNYRVGPGFAGDWDMISAVLKEYKPAFVPDAFVWFNYLEPGRWNEVKL
jgi:hypothetical protein